MHVRYKPDRKLLHDYNRRRSEIVKKTLHGNADLSNLRYPLTSCPHPTCLTLYSAYSLALVGVLLCIAISHLSSYSQPLSIASLYPLSSPRTTPTNSNPNTMSVKRITKASTQIPCHRTITQLTYSQELTGLVESPPEGIKVELVDETDIHHWKVFMEGPEDSPYRVHVPPTIQLKRNLIYNREEISSLSSSCPPSTPSSHRPSPLKRKYTTPT